MAVLQPVLEAHLVTGEPWWQTHIREEERIPGGHGVALSKTRVGQQRFREAMLDRFGEACAFTGPQPPGALEAAHLYLYSKNPEHDVRGGLLLRATCTRCSTDGLSPSTPIPGKSRSHQNSSAIPASLSSTARPSNCPNTYDRSTSTFRSTRLRLERPGVDIGPGRLGVTRLIASLTGLLRVLVYVRQARSSHAACCTDFSS